MSQRDMGLLLVPQPAGYRTVYFGNVKRRLYFPYSLFAIHYSKGAVGYQMHRLQVAFSQKPITGKNDDAKLYGLPLSNADMGFGICLYNFANGKTLKELAREAIKLYWSTSFVQVNDGYGHWLRTYKGSGLMKKWRENPESIMEADLKQSSYTINVGKLKASVKAKVTVMAKVTDKKPKLKLPKVKA